MSVNGETIRSAVDMLIVRYTNEKRGIEVKLIPTSSLWLELGLGATTWRKLDLAISAVSGKGLGHDYSPDWLKEHAGEIAALL